MMTEMREADASITWFGAIAMLTVGAAMVASSCSIRVRSSSLSSPPPQADASHKTATRLAATRRDFRAHVLRLLREACASDDEYEREARAIFGG